MHIVLSKARFGAVHMSRQSQGHPLWFRWGRSPVVCALLYTSLGVVPARLSNARRLPPKIRFDFRKEFRYVFFWVRHFNNFIFKKKYSCRKTIDCMICDVQWLNNETKINFCECKFGRNKIDKNVFYINGTLALHLVSGNKRRICKNEELELGVRRENFAFIGVNGHSW